MTIADDIRVKIKINPIYNNREKIIDVRLLGSHKEKYEFLLDIMDDIRCHTRRFGHDLDTYLFLGRHGAPRL